jgi:uncharacterized protein DUF5941
MSTAPGIAIGEALARTSRTPLERYRDDGPLARLLGAAIGRAIPVPPLPIALVGTAGLLAIAAMEGDAASNGAVALAVAWFVLWAGVSSGRPHTDRFAWALPGVIRVGEYGAVIWIGTTVGESSSAAAFALIAALAFRHYDLVYRPRFQGSPPAAWLDVVLGGWDGRLILVALLLVADALPAALFVLAGVLAVVLVTECVASWARHVAAPVSIYEDEEDEGD